jgi:hypothetical protein
MSIIECSVTVECEECGYDTSIEVSVSIGNTIDERELEKNLQSEGWTVDKGCHLCPDCSDIEDPEEEELDEEDEDDFEEEDEE